MSVTDDPKTLGRTRLSFASEADIDEFVEVLDKFERGELTPTQKVKRRAIDKHYKTLIDSLYADAERSGITDSHAIL